ncbi:MAG: putative rane protein [Streptosporangiaceae bacterium]|nr:putative rane protein [Streptosporangiaceae bacterium]
MSSIREDRIRYRISIVDEDPLRARREARELLREIADADPEAALVVPGQSVSRDTDKGGVSADAIGLVLNAGSLVAAGVQVWLARVPQRTITIARPDGATLRITGREARADDERIERFLADGGKAAHDEGGDDGATAG